MEVREEFSYPAPTDIGAFLSYSSVLPRMGISRYVVDVEFCGCSSWAVLRPHAIKDTFTTSMMPYLSIVS